MLNKKKKLNRIEPMEVSSMIVKTKSRSMGWIGQGAQAWIEFFCEKHFAHEAFKLSLTH